MRTALCFFVTACLLLAAPVHAQEQPHVFRNATIYPIASEPIEDGALVVQEGEVQAVGATEDVQVPDGAQEHDLSGKVLMPGLVDTHSHIGQVSGGDGSAALHPGVRTIDGINVMHSSLDRARAGGVTAVNVLSGSGHLLSGQTTYLKLRDGTTVADLNACDDRPIEACGGMKMANGTNPQREEGPLPGTRARAAAMARQLLTEAQAYKQKKEAAESSDEMPDRDLQMEGLVDVLNGDRIVHFHTHRHDDILTAIRLSEEFDFRLVLHHVSEGWKVPEEIAEADASASIITIDSPGGKHEADEMVYRTGRVLDEAGVGVSYHTDDPITDSRLFLRSPAFGVRAGMDRDAALESVTLEAARQMGLADEVGSLEPGKDADFVVLSGDPLSAYTKVQETWVEGAKVFDRSTDADQEVATGGYRVLDEAIQHVHGIDE
ncbi:MAG: amidohydrolase family protein [Salinibacter sp.]